VFTGVTVTVLLMLHGIIAVVLLGLTTHQAVAVWRHKPIAAKNVVEAYVNTRAPLYTNAIIVIYIVSFILGGIIYPTYVMDVRGTLTDAGMFWAIGTFDIKEHFAVIGLMMLPTYWWFWKRAQPTEHVLARQLNTTIICFFVWVTFVIGYLLNNIKGLT
jgi:hypothetical protein